MSFWRSVGTRTRKYVLVRYSKERDVLPGGDDDSCTTLQKYKLQISNERLIIPR